MGQPYHSVINHRIRDDWTIPGIQAFLLPVTYQKRKHPMLTKWPEAGGSVQVHWYKPGQIARLFAGKTTMDMDHLQVKNEERMLTNYSLSLECCGNR